MAAHDVIAQLADELTRRTGYGYEQRRATDLGREALEAFATSDDADATYAPPRQPRIVVQQRPDRHDRAVGVAAGTRRGQDAPELPPGA